MLPKNYCTRCGERLTTRFTEGRERPFCEACGVPVYENPVPATAIVVVDEEERILLVRRAEDPKKGEWCLPGGFMELSESPEECALRELLEETALTGGIGDFLGATISPSDRYGNVLLLGYLVRSFQGEPAAGTDASDIAFFAREEMPRLAFDSHERFTRIYFACFSCSCEGEGQG
ncbi:MAG: NUDIX domain-containing protein [Thermodesulfobacteriota bacterium]